MSVTAPPVAPDKKQEQVTAPPKLASWPKWLPAWVQELPVLNFPPPPGKDFVLIRQKHVDQMEKELKELEQYDPTAFEQINKDIEFMDYELLRLFRERDHEAKSQQNRYRVYQLGFLLLSGIATMIGAFQALALNSDPAALPRLAFIETAVALAAIFLATISGREPALPRWLDNRRRAEQLRREYFRYLMNLPPYDKLDGYKRLVELSNRAADINRGVFPEETGVLA